MEDPFKYADQYGPSKIVHVYEPSVNLKAILVIDNTAAGPSIGGIRIAPDVTTEECVRLARAMTWKNASAGLPHGGGKIVIQGDPKMPKQEKEQILRALCQNLRGLKGYIFAPDMGTNEECMAWIRDEVGRVVALPRELGGIPLDEIGATGWGVTQATEVALAYCDFDLQNARVVVQGFGAVGKHTAKFLIQKGAKLVATADSQGGIYNPNGLDVTALIELKRLGKSVVDYPDGTRLDQDGIIEVESDIWIPAARPDVIDESNVDRLNTKLLVQGANIPMTLAAEKRLFEKGVLYIPDFIANAGGVICAAMEYHGANESTVMSAIEEKVKRNTKLILEAVKKDNLLPRQAAERLAVARVEKAMSFRRFSLFSTAPAYV